MWWGKSEPRAHAWLGSTRVAWRLDGEASCRLGAVKGWDEGVESLAQWQLDSRKRASKLSVCIDGDLCRLHSVPAIEGAADRTEAEAALSAHVNAINGSMGNDAVRVATWPAEGPRWLVVAVAEGVLDLLAKRLGTALASVRPWWWWSIPFEGGRVALFDGCALTYCDIDERGCPQDAGTLSPLLDDGAAQRWLRRRSLADADTRREIYRLSWGGAGLTNSVSALENVGALLRRFPFADWVQRAEQQQG